MLKLLPTLTATTLGRHALMTPVVVGAVMSAVMISGAWAQPSGTKGAIYTCVDGSGKRLTSDRLIPDCLDREQRLLNQDGSLQRIVPPRLNAQERAAQEARKREKELAEAAQKDAIRRDRNLLLRYPNEAVHAGAREAAMDDVYKGIALTERRLQDVRAERKALEAEAEFYKGRRLPPKLRSQLETSEAQQQAHLQIIEQQQAEIVRINGIYDAELARLRQLWAGAPLGFGGGLSPVGAAPAATATLTTSRP